MHFTPYLKKYFPPPFILIHTFTFGPLHIIYAFYTLPQKILSPSLHSHSYFYIWPTTHYLCILHLTSKNTFPLPSFSFILLHLAHYTLSMHFTPYLKKYFPPPFILIHTFTFGPLHIIYAFY